MNDKWLISCGLSQKQARTYRALVTLKKARPASIAKLTGETRSNCYALLDKLVELGLATKVDENKKFTYYPTSPLALKTLLDKKRQETENQIADLERKMPHLLSAYQIGGEAPKVTIHRGKKELEKMYVQQLKQKGAELHFIRTRADIAYFGLQKMQEIRFLSGAYKKQRFGITPFLAYGKRSVENDSRAGNLKRAWIESTDYTAKVEWVVSGDQVQAICLDKEGYGITIDHPEIAKSMQQILQLLQKNIKQNPDYNPRT